MGKKSGSFQIRGHGGPPTEGDGDHRTCKQTRGGADSLEKALNKKKGATPVCATVNPDHPRTRELRYRKKLTMQKREGWELGEVKTRETKHDLLTSKPKSAKSL